MIKKVFFCLFFLSLLMLVSACSFPGRQIPEMPDAPSRIDKQPVREKEVSVLDQAPVSEDTVSGYEVKKNRSTAPENRDLLKKQAIDLQLEQGDVLAALKWVDPYLRQGTCGKSLSDAYLRALNHAILKGRSRLAENRPEEAGQLFRAASESFPKNSDLALKVLMTPAELDGRISFCADQLMEQGLMEYRQGRLEDAINIWEKIAVFAPGHQASRNAIRTAYTQLTNLKKIDKSPGDKSR